MIKYGHSFILLSTLLLLSVASCKKEKKPLTVVTPTQPVSYHIQANVDGSLVTADYAAPNSWLVTNVYFNNDKQGQFERFVSSSTTQGWNFYFENLDLDNITYPKTLKQTNLTNDPYILMTYNNGTTGTDGDFIINNLDSNLFSLTINSWSNDVIEGTFAGDLRWSGSYDSTLTFTNGEFRIEMGRF